MVTVTMPSCKGQRFNHSNSRMCWLDAFEQDVKTTHSVTPKMTVSHMLTCSELSGVFSTFHTKHRTSGPRKTQ